MPNIVKKRSLLSPPSRYSILNEIVKAHELNSTNKIQYDRDLGIQINKIEFRRATHQPIVFARIKRNLRENWT